MSTQSKTIPWAFATRITTLATNTTLGTSTRHDFAAITIELPELTRTIRSVKLRVTARDTFTASTTQSFTGWRIGIKLGATAFDDVDYSTIFTSIDHETLKVERDVTAYFVTNFGANATQTCQVGVAFSGASASNVNCITAELLITYDFDNTAATQLRCTEIIIQGNNVTLTASDLEIGTGLGVSDAPVNQIPILDGSGTFNPEAGKVFKQIYLRITATDNETSNATNFNLSVKLDAGSYDARATVGQALVTGAQYHDLIDLTVAPYSINTAAVHALVMKTSLSGTFGCISAVLVVVYTFTTSGTTRAQYSFRVPLDNERSGSGAQSTMPAAAGDTERYTITFDIQEPGTITFQQSGVVIYDHNPTGSSASASSGAPGQTTRTMNHVTGIVRSGPSIWTRRCDFGGTTWALVRGTNRLYYDARCNVSGAMVGLTGYAIINYTADIPATGFGSGNRSCAYSLTSHPALAAGGSIISAEERLPSIPSTPWKMFGAWVDIGCRASSNTGTFSVQAERQIGEDSEDGWYNRTALATNYNITCRREIIFALTDWVRQSSFRTLGMSTLATRRWRFSQFSTQNEWCGTTWIVLHTISFTVAGSVTIGGVAVANGSTVRIYADDGVTTEYITSVTTTGGTGAFTASVTDNTRNHFAVYDGGSVSTRGWSANGTPGTSTFDITLGVTVGLALAMSGGAKMQTIKQSTADDVRFTMRSTTTGALVDGLAGSITVTLCKKGQTSHSTITPIITGLGSGRYNAALTAAHADTIGIADYVPTATGAVVEGTPMFDVVAVDRNNATSMGLGRLDVAVSTLATQVSVNAVQTDVDDIQAHLPTLVGGRIPADVGSWRGTAVATPAVEGIPRVEISSIGANTLTATAIASAAFTATKFATDAIDANAIAATAVTKIQTGLSTSTALGTLQTSATDIQNRLPASLDNGNIKASVQSLINNSITANVIATDAIDSDAIAASAVTELQAGLVTTTDLNTAVSGLITLLNQIETDIGTLPTEIGQLSVETGIDLLGALRTVVSAAAGKRSVVGNLITHRNVADTKDVIVGTMSGEDRIASAVNSTP